MHAQAEVAQVAVGVRLLRVGTVLVARRDEFDGGDELAVEIDVDGPLRVEADGNACFQVRLQDGGTGGAASAAGRGPICRTLTSGLPLPASTVKPARRRETPCTPPASGAEPTRRDTPTRTGGRCPSPVRRSNRAAAWLSPPSIFWQFTMVFARRHMVGSMTTSCSLLPSCQGPLPRFSHQARPAPPATARQCASTPSDRRN